MLRSKNIILGVSGSIAAYKSAVLTRLLVKEGVNVRVILTEAAGEFVGPLTFATLSKNPVLDQFVKNPATGEWNNHVRLGLWADALLVAPATANTIAKFAGGICDNLLSAVYLSARCPVFLAPAMDLDMFVHPAVRENLQKMEGFGHKFVEPGSGELASGLHGKGRMAEPEEIVEALRQHFGQSDELVGKKVLITAGPTREPLDPVRFITNRSSGKMGYALAEELAGRGAEVRLMSGPAYTNTRHPNVQKVAVATAREMFDAVMEKMGDADVIIHAAAVADYRPKEFSSVKIKKKSAETDLILTKTDDIAAEAGKRVRPGQLHIGFALETNNEIENAKGKLERKNFDLIILNSLRDPGAGFDFDTNKVYIIDRREVREMPLKTKKELAADLTDLICLKVKEKEDEKDVKSSS